MEKDRSYVEITDNVFNFDGLEITLNPFHIDGFQNSSSDVAQNENTSICKEKEPPNQIAINTENTANNHVTQESKPFFSTGVLLHPINTYENIIELVNINPHANVLDDNTNTTIYEVYNSNAVVSFASVPCESSGNHGFNKFQFTYETGTNVLDETPEFIDINQFSPKKFEEPESSNLLLNSGDKNKESLKEDSDKKRQDDDAVFIKEHPAIEEKDQEEVSPSDDQVKVRKRRRRKNCVEKRKNPVRKAQIEKASAALIEKLAIPSCVFNAKIKNRRHKSVTTDYKKSVRQSARTSGAIRRSPVPLTKDDFKVWPASGIYEKPFYNQVTNEIEKYDDSSIFASKSAKLSTKNATKDIDESSGSLTNKNSKPRPGEELDKTKKFAVLTNNRLKMLLNYFKELKCCNTLMVTEQRDKQVIERFYEMLKDACILHRLAANLDEEEFISYITNLWKAEVP